MGLIILQKLEAKPRTILRDGRCIEVNTSAFVGATDAEICQFGIGLIDDDGKSLFWAMVCPQMLITAWRGMQILDRATNVLSGTICHAYFAGQSDEKNSDTQKGIMDLANQIPDITEFRKTVLSTPIPDKELDSMLKICNDPKNGIDINIAELKEAVEAKIINQTEEVSHAYQIATDAEMQRRRDEAISEQPLPEHKSFCKFCEKFGIRYLHDNPYYDWPGYWSTEHIDEHLVYNGLRFEGLEEVWCAEKPKHSSGYGHIGQPVLQLDNESIIVLLRVRFLDNDMWVETRPVKGADAAEWGTISQLSARNPHFIGLTFDSNDHPKPEDMARGYFALRATKNPLKKAINALKS